MVDKLILLCLFVLIAIIVIFLNSRSMNAKAYTYLALGDSYTIGEGVLLHESFPYQVIQLLRVAGYSFNAPEIVAATGWTTEALKTAIRKISFQQSYDFVSLLIGVNDQYRHRPMDAYGTQFETLLEQALRFTGGKPAQVFVLSIPDWGLTPFAAGKDREVISREIDLFNATNENIARHYHVNYINVSEGVSGQESGWLAADQLHPSGKQYAQWAAAIAGIIQKSFA